METEYAYAVGKIRALENRLLSRFKLEQFLEMSQNSVIQELENRGYERVKRDKEPIGGLKNKELESFESMIDDHLNKVYKIIRNLSLEPSITDAFCILYDGHNLKVLIKKKYTQSKEQNRLLLERGLYEQEELKEMVEKNNFSSLPQKLRNVPHRAIEKYESSKNPQYIDFILDCKFLEYFREQGKGNYFSNKIAEIKIDLINILTFLRLKVREQKVGVLNQALISGGAIDKRKFLDNFFPSKTIEDFIRGIKSTPYVKIVKEGYSEWKSSHSFGFLEKLSDNFLINYIRKAKYISLGIEPLIGYLLAKENETKNLRIIFFGKYFNWEKKIIKERIRETYV